MFRIEGTKASFVPLLDLSNDTWHVVLESGWSIGKLGNCLDSSSFFCSLLFGFSSSCSRLSCSCSLSLSLSLSLLLGLEAGLLFSCLFSLLSLAIEDEVVLGSEGIDEFEHILCLSLAKVVLWGVLIVSKDLDSR